MFIPTRWNMRLRRFAQDEEGAQVIEYALIIAMTSITLALILRGEFFGRRDRGSRALSPSIW